MPGVFLWVSKSISKKLEISSIFLLTIHKVFAIIKMTLRGGQKQDDTGRGGITTQKGKDTMTNLQKENIIAELNWNTEWYYKNSESGFDKAAATNWDTVKGMQKALAMMGYTTNYKPGSGWEVTNG